MDDNAKKRVELRRKNWNEKETDESNALSKQIEKWKIVLRWADLSKFTNGG